MARRLFLWTQERAAHHGACGREAGRAVRGCGPAAVGLAFGEEGSVDRLAEIPRAAPAAFLSQNDTAAGDKHGHALGHAVQAPSSRRRVFIQMPRVGRNGAPRLRTTTRV